MRWAYVGNFVPPYSTENYIAETIRRRGDTIECFQENDLGAWKAVADRVVDFDAVLWTRTPWRPVVPNNLQRVLLRAADRAHVPTVGYHLDRWFGLARERDVTTEPFFRVNLLCTADGGHDEEFEKAGVTHRWTPPAVAGWHAERVGAPRPEFETDVTFVGHWQGYHPEWAWRQQLVEWLRSTYGDRCRFWSGELSDEDLNDAYVSARVVVGDSCLAGDATRYWSNRVPETLARGGLLIHPNVVGLDEHFTPGEHLVTFDVGDVDGLRAVVDRYVEDHDERDRVRAAGRAHALACHTFEVRVAQVVADMVVRGWLPEPPIERMIGKAGRVVVRDVAFELRDGSVDGKTLDEIWSENVYRATPDLVAGGLVLDIGANVGAFSLWAAAAGATVVAYEPHDENREALLANLAANPTLAERVQVEPRAVGGEPAMIGMSALVPGAEADAHVNGAGDVPMTTLRHAILEAICTTEHDVVAFVKIDAEWSEYDMALTVGDALRLVRRMAIEFHAPWTHHPEQRVLDTAQVDRFGKLVAYLAEHGSVEVLGRPSVGGYLYWTVYDT